MAGRLLHRCLLASLAACILLASRGARGAPNDAAVQKLRDQAVYTDYLATEFDAAANKLKKALELCKAPTDCAPSVRARVTCDLGVIEFALKRPDDGRAHFAAALEEDPSVTLSPDLSTIELVREFAAVKGGGARTAASAKPPPKPQGDMAHSPPASQAVMTPVPIYVELPEGVRAARVYVRYRPPGGPDWKTAPMSKVGAGYGVELPCGEVGDSPGVIPYFVQAVDASGDLVASSGRITDPYRVTIVAKLEGERPHLPGRAPPSACAAATDCPPGFPGCHAAAPQSTACVSDDECEDGQSCADGVCRASDRHSDRPSAPYKKNWLSVAFQEDALLLPSAGDACAGGTGYTCFGSDGTHYDALPLAGADDQVNGGLTLATMRVLFGYDRALGENVTLGARLGFALGGGPQRPGAATFLPLHAEARAAYWFGNDPLARAGFRVFVLAAGGAAQIDAAVPVDVYANRQAYEGGQSQSYQAWRKTGLGFVALGGGTMFAFTPATGIALEARAMEMFPTTATGFGLQMAYLVGL
jgi:hypothetical protein